MLSVLLFQGKEIPYNPDDENIDIALMFGFAKIGESGLIVDKRIGISELAVGDKTLIEAVV